MILDVRRLRRPILAHDAPRCVRCKVRYWSSTCQHDRWLTASDKQILSDTPRRQRGSISRRQKGLEASSGRRGSSAPPTTQKGQNVVLCLRKHCTGAKVAGRAPLFCAAGRHCFSRVVVTAGDLGHGALTSQRCRPSISGRWPQPQPLIAAISARSSRTQKSSLTQ